MKRRGMPDGNQRIIGGIAAALAVGLAAFGHPLLAIAVILGAITTAVLTCAVRGLAGGQTFGRTVALGGVRTFLATVPVVCMQSYSYGTPDVEGGEASYCSTFYFLPIPGGFLRRSRHRAASLT